MNYHRSFLAIVREILDRNRANTSVWPSSLVSQWEGLVQECEEGYQWDISEFHNEMRSRRLLQQLIDSPELLEFPERKELARVVEGIDVRFRRLLRPDVQLERGEWWWERGVLASAGVPYVDYMRRAYGIEVGVKPG